jgi:hypothetical protein
MIAILLAVGFASKPDLLHVLLPVGAYVVVNINSGGLLQTQTP